MMRSVPKRITAALLLTVLLFPLIVSCAPPMQGEETTDTYCTFTDDTGRKIALTEKPQRVAVLFSSLADIWNTAGGEIAITVGETVERGFAAKDVPLVDSGAGKTVNTELLIAHKPDLVICSADVAGQAEAAKLLNSHGIPAACFRVESFADYLRVLEICTRITESPEAYREHGVLVKERIDGMLAAIDGQCLPSQRILFVRASSSSVKAKTGEQHFAAAMLEELGTHNIALDAPILIDGISEEVIVQKDPEVIFVSVMGSEEGAQANLAQNRVWQSLSAVKNGRCHYLPKDLFQYKPNSQWDEAYLYLIELLYENIEIQEAA